MSFRIATFNLQFGQYWSDQNPDQECVDLSKAIDVMKQAQADIYLLQEVEFVADPRKQVQPPPNLQKIKEAFPNFECHFSYPPEDSRELPFGYGQCILSRFPLSDLYTAFLPPPEIEFDFFGERKTPAPRVMIGAKVWIEDQLVQLYNVHLQAVFMLRDLNSDDYPVQRDIVEKHIRESYLPTVWGGDLNAAPSESTVSQFESAGYTSVQKRDYTWKRRPYVTDHLFYNNTVQLDRYQILRSDASDHDMVIGDFSLSRSLACPPQSP